MPPTISWDENSPPDGESAGLGDDRIRSLKSSVRVGLDSEHVWPSGGGEAGAHRLGTGRAHYGVQSAVSSTGSDGRIMITSDSSRLFGVGSGGTVFFGGATSISAGSYPGAVPQRHHWVMNFGNTDTGSNGSVVVTIPNSGYSGVPWVVVTHSQTASGVTSRIFGVTVKTPTTFNVGSFNENGDGIAGVSFDWMSMGSRVL